MKRDEYWLKEWKTKLVCISWGVDEGHPNSLIWLPKSGFDLILFGYRLVIEF